ncbi:alkaline phosphatase family protein [Nocardioides terrisoli]|uniref:alkaline phosphatase family protein n=1 Tax=Nocardioides terrisoli TaxID=3388267 RepID=UPI00287BB369|nr:alkaline phosphatase family protein [Nocardioides marmorisolisilvae]
MTTPATPAPGGPAGFAGVEHLVVLMLENRSFDHMLGYLYAEAGNVSPAGDPFEGLTGSESCPGSDGQPVPVYQLTPQTQDVYFYPGADPGEGYAATNRQCYGSSGPPAAGATAPMSGFVTDYASAIAANRAKGWYVFAGTAESWIMGCHTPATLPVLSALARGFAVCDHWYGAAPTMTMPNRAFVCAGTSQGHMDDVTKAFTCPSIFGSLGAANLAWKIYGYTSAPLTKSDFPDTKTAPAANFGHFADFEADCRTGSLPVYAFLEPSWGSDGNSQHPNYNLALGEQLLLETYRALRDSPAWEQTLLVITYDEHGGCYDHVSPPWGATPPDQTVGEYGFDFTRFGPRVPAVLVSPFIEAGTVYRAPGQTPLDHTSILATIEKRWGIAPLTARDAAAPDLAGALTLTTARTDDPLASVTAPPAPTNPTGLVVQASHLQQIQAALIADQAGRPPEELAVLQTNADYQRYIDEHG